MNKNKPISIDFRAPENRQELLTFLGIQEFVLDKAIKGPTSTDESSDGEDVEDGEIIKLTDLSFTKFQKHFIPKCGNNSIGEYRIVWEAGPFLAEAYKTFARRFDLFLRFVESDYPHPCAYGYVRGKNTIENATPHCGKKLILHADIKDFFPSISSNIIYKKFLGLGINEKVSEILSQFLTIEGSLPLGLHASPMLANLICLKMDSKFENLAKQYNCTYTRYADDITISGNRKLPSKDEIQNILSEEGFILSERKYRITKPGQAHYVTGLSVTDKNLPRAPRGMKKSLRQELYYCTKYGITDHMHHLYRDGRFIQAGINRLDGMVRYVSNIEGNEMPDLRKDWHALMERDDVEPSYFSIEDRGVRFISVYIDEAELKHNNKKSLAISLAVTEDSNQISSVTEKILREHIVNPFSGGKKKELEKKKMHYADANKDLRRSYIEQMSVFPFKGYIAYGSLESYDNYEKLYLSLLSSLLTHRLMDCDGAEVNMIFEQNSRIKKTNIERIVSNIYSKLEKSNNRRPRSIPEIIIGNKNEYSCFSLPDFLLGAWADYIKEHQGNGDQARVLFECLRDKYKKIVNTDKSIVFSRKRPFIPDEFME